MTAVYQMVVAIIQMKTFWDILDIMNVLFP